MNTAFRTRLKRLWVLLRDLLPWRSQWRRYRVAPEENSAKMRRELLRSIRREMRDAAKSARDDEFSVDKEDRRYHSVADAEDDIAWSGIHRSALRDAVGSRELEEAIQELRDGNLFYPG